MKTLYITTSSDPEPNQGKPLPAELDPWSDPLDVYTQEELDAVNIPDFPLGHPQHNAMARVILDEKKKYDQDLPNLYLKMQGLD